MKSFRTYFTEAEEKKLLNTVKRVNDIHAKRDYAWMRALRHTGLRINAFSLLTVGHAQEAIRTNYIKLEGEIQKRAKKHELYVTKSAREALTDLLKVLKKQGYALIPSRPLVMSRRGQALSVRSYQDRMHYWCEQAGFEFKASPHWWRHTFAKRILKYSTSDSALLIAKEALGHASINSTTIYTAPDKEEVELALEQAS